MEAVHSCIVSLPVKSLLSICLLDIIINFEKVCQTKLGCPRKLE